MEVTMVVMLFSCLVTVSLLIERHFIKADRDRFRAALIKMEGSVDAACREYSDHLIAVNEKLKKTVDHQESLLCNTIDKVQQQSDLIDRLKEDRQRQDAIFKSSQKKMRSIMDIVNTPSYSQDGIAIEKYHPIFNNSVLNADS